jgi:hypothetical protein
MPEQKLNLGQYLQPLPNSLQVPTIPHDRGPGAKDPFGRLGLV